MGDSAELYLRTLRRLGADEGVIAAAEEAAAEGVRPSSTLALIGRIDALMAENLALRGTGAVLGRRLDELLH